MVYQGWYELGRLMANFLVDSHYEDIQKIFDSMGTMAAGFADAFKEAWGAIPAFFEGVFSTVENIWNKIKEIIDKVKGVKDQISGWFGKDGDSGKMDFLVRFFASGSSVKPITEKLSEVKEKNGIFGWRLGLYRQFFRPKPAHHRISGNPPTTPLQTRFPMLFPTWGPFTAILFRTS